MPARTRQAMAPALAHSLLSPRPLRVDERTEQKPENDQTYEDTYQILGRLEHGFLLRPMGYRYAQ
jgi:hypothetical protein